MHVSPKTWNLLRMTGRALGDPSHLFQNVDISEIAKSRLVIFGEVHAAPTVVAVQHEVQKHMISHISASPQSAKLHVVMEHFSLEMQTMLNRYLNSEIDLSTLAKEYHDIGTEGHDVNAYKEVLEFARENPQRCVLHGGFIPRTYARTLMRDGVEVALTAAKEKNYVEDTEECESTDEHYRFFESLLTGKDPQDFDRPLSDQFRRMLPAQVLKDAR